MSLTLPKAVLFDWDNTLADSFLPIQQALNHTFRFMGRELWTMAETRKHVGGSLRDNFPLMFGERWREAAKVFYKHFDGHHLKGIEPMPGAGDLLSTFKEAGTFVGIVSNKRGDYLRQEVAYLGWNDYFAKIVGANDAVEDKPATAPVHLALRGSGTAPGPDVWFVGDNALDVSCAEASGCLPILINGAAHWPEGSPLPKWQFDDCFELAACIRNLNSSAFP